ncbi:MAG: SDR family oxidoreductase [Pseudomonadales bacterium]|nr:SDR family oxidoreductase [Pseudomonadales bacterium]
MATTSELFDLSGKVALLTGSSRGMGEAMAMGLAEAGAKVVVSSRKLDQCEETAKNINDSCGAGSATALSCNIGYKEQLQKLVDDTHDALGSIDILVCNASINHFYGQMSEIPDEAFDKIMNTNVRSNHWLCQMVAPDMISTGKGSIMLTSSIGAFGPSTTLGVYGISKLAEIGMVRNLAAELGPSGIRVNAICPGVVKTEFARVLWDNAEAQKRTDEETPLRRFGEPDDFKGVAVFLASDASAYMTGQALTVCGGTHMWR